MTTSDSYFRLLCEQMGVAVTACHADLRICVWNLAAARMFGAAADQMLDSPLVMVLPAAHRDTAQRMLTTTIASGESFQLDFDDHDRSGGRRELACTIAPVVLESGERIGASACFRDITARIRLQTEVDGSRKMAALGQMAGGVSHHFNNILGGIVTSVDFAIGQEDPAAHRRALVQAGKSLARATTLLRGLLSFAEGDRRGEDLGDVTEIVNEIADELEELLQEKNIALTLELPQLPIIPVGRSQLLTVLRNLTQNAVEAMPDGGALTLRVIFEETSLRIEVADTGCGLDEAAFSHLFEPFYSSKGILSSTNGQGAGLGLAIAHGIIQSLGGTIRATSHPKQGACFIVTLPVPIPPVGSVRSSAASDAGF